MQVKKRGTVPSAALHSAYAEVNAIRMSRMRICFSCGVNLKFYDTAIVDDRPYQNDFEQADSKVNTNQKSKFELSLYRPYSQHPALYQFPGK